MSDAGGTFGVLYSWDILMLDGDPADVSPSTVANMCTHTEGRDVASLYHHIIDMLDYANINNEKYKFFIHNLTYDCGFFRHLLLNLDNLGYDVQICARNSTHLLNAAISFSGRELMVIADTLAMFRTSLRSLGDALGYRKLELDYSKAVAPDTRLDPQALAYNRRDTELLMVAVCRNLLSLPYLDADMLGSKVLTKTGMVRQLDRTSEHIGKLEIGGKSLYDIDRIETAEHQFASEGELALWRSYSESRGADIKGCYAGGVNLSNTEEIGRILCGVSSFDLVSAYPGIMLAYRVPCGCSECACPAIYQGLLDVRELPDPTDVAQLRCGFWIGQVVFEGFQVRPEWAEQVADTSLTVAMARQCQGSVGIRYRAGWLVGADRLVLTLSTPTFLEMRAQYTWRTARFQRLWLFSGAERPTYYSTVSVLHHFAEKTAAKELARDPQPDKVYRAYDSGYITFDECQMLASGHPDEAWTARFVMSHKENLNSLYGIKVTNPMREEFDLGPTGYIESCGQMGFADYRKLPRDRKIWRESGVMVSLFNRYKLIYAARKVVEAGGKVLYADTDSLKVQGIDPQRFAAVMRPVHERVSAAVAETVAHVSRKVGGLDVPDNVVRLGTFDYEGTYARFFSPGHKKYAFDDGHGWRPRCAGYKVSVVQGVLDALSEFSDDAPMMALGFDVRYDSTTDIATALLGVQDTWREVEFEALDSSDGSATHTYRGYTCPGYAVVPVGKIMNNTLANELNAQRAAKAFANEPRMREYSHCDIAKYSGEYVWGKAGDVPMEWKGWGVTGGDAVL